MSVETSLMGNGMRLVTDRMPHLETVSLGVWVEAGSRSERPREHGLSHLLEHMAFKGTGGRSARDIAEQIEAVGGDLNAATSLETTTYYARVLKADVGLALELLSDILLNPRFDEAELAREKDVILQEIAAARDCPDDIVFDLAQEAAFPDQPLGRPILGTAERVRAFTPRDLRDYLAAKYGAHRIVIAAAGNLRHDEFATLAESHFGALEGPHAAAPEPARYRGGTRLGPSRFEQSHLAVAFEGPPYGGGEIYAAQLLSSILGGGMSSRLFQEAREKRGLCYAIYSFCWGVADSGLFGVHAATGPDQIPELTEVISQELARLAEAAPPAHELARAKAGLKAGLMMALESSGARAEQLARQMIVFGRPLGIDEVIEKVEEVSAEAVRSEAAEILLAAEPSFAVVGSAAPARALEALVSAFAFPVGAGRQAEGGVAEWRF